MKYRCLITMLIILVTFSGCGSVNKKVVMNQNEQGVDKIESQHYSKNGVEGEFPVVTTGEDTKNIQIWNKLIQNDFKKVLGIYSFMPIPAPAPSPTTATPILLTIRYETKQNNKDRLSILYLADFNATFTAHPTELTYTTNIDKKNNNRLKLSDIVKLNEDFVKEFRGWNFISAEPGNAELNLAIKDYFINMSDEDILLGFKNADIIGSGNLMDVYSYTTPTRLGISFGVPHYIGDHIEFEQDFDKLQNYLIKK